MDPVRAETHYFVCNVWLACDIGEGRVDRTFKIASDADLYNAEHLFFTHTNRYLQCNDISRYHEVPAAVMSSTSTRK